MLIEKRSEEQYKHREILQNKINKCKRTSRVYVAFINVEKMTRKQILRKGCNGQDSNSTANYTYCFINSLNMKGYVKEIIPEATDAYRQEHSCKQKNRMQKFCTEEKPSADSVGEHINNKTDYTEQYQPLECKAGMRIVSVREHDVYKRNDKNTKSKARQIRQRKINGVGIYEISTHVFSLPCKQSAWILYLLQCNSFSQNVRKSLVQRQNGYPFINF
jgi:hypothetical protein